MNRFKPGDVVECIDDSSVAAHSAACVTAMVKAGERYTVRAVANFAGIPGIYLEEIVSGPRRPWGEEEQSWLESRFKLAAPQ